MDSKIELDADVEALRQAGLGVEEVDIPNIYALQRQAREITRANERLIKGFYVDWLFGKLNLDKYR